MTSIENIEILKFLLDHGAMVNVKDEQKKTALQYAIENEKWEAAEILKCYGATPFQRDFNDIFSLEQLFELKTGCCNTPTSECHGWICSLSTPTHTLLIQKLINQTNLKMYLMIYLENNQCEINKDDKFMINAKLVNLMKFIKLRISQIL